MSEFLKYILESGIALAIFYFFYEIGLKKETCFAQNRLYLLITPILSFLLPLFNLPIYFYTENPDNAVFELSPVQIISMEYSSGGFTLAEIIIYLYLMGMIILFVKMALDYWRLSRVIDEFKKEFTKKDNIFEVSSDDFHATFSFLNYIFWKVDPTMSESDRLKIRHHELIHVRQKHSYDLIYIKILCAILWFNPVIWMYRLALENTHEFLADNSVIDQEDKYSYIRLLVSEVFRDSGFETVHHFGKSRTSKRIEMMKLKSYVSDKGRFLLVIPLSLIMLLVFSFEMRQLDINELDKEIDKDLQALDITIYKNADINREYIRIEDGKLTAQIDDLSINIENIDSRAKMDKAFELINSLNLELSVDKQSDIKKLPEFPGGMSAWNSYLKKNLSIDKNPQTEVSEKRVYIEFTVEKNGKVEGVKLIQGADQFFNEESLRVIRSSPDWIPGHIEGKPIRVKMIVPVILKLG